MIDIDENITTQTLVMLIAAGLPEFIRNKIDKEKFSSSTSLFNEIKKCENLIKKSNSFIKKRDKPDYRKTYEEKKPCRICEKLNKGPRYHPEDACWFNKKNQDDTKIVGSNSAIEVNLNTEQKNE